MSEVNAHNLNGLPKGWRIGNIEELVEKGKHALKAGPFGSALKKDFYVKDGYKIYGQEQVISGDPNFGNYFISEEKYNELRSNSVKPFDILISLVGTVGKVLILPEGCKDGIINPRLIKIRLNRSVYLPKFFKYYFESSAVKSFYNSKAQGTTMDVLNLGIIKTIPFPICPISEQQRIIEKIEKLFSELDKSIEDLKTAQQQLKVYRQSVLKWAFEGKLTERWRSENIQIKPATKFLEEVQNSRKNKREKKLEYDFKYYQSEIKSWATAKLDKLIYIAARIGWRGLKKDEYTEAGPQLLSVHSLNYGKYVNFKDAYHISEERYIESPEIMLQENDILLCKDGAGIGKLGIVKRLEGKATVNSSLLVIRGLEVFIPEFLFYLFSGPKLQRIVQERITGSATPHLFQNDIRKFELDVPPIEEQKEIVSEIESRFSVADSVEETIINSLEQVEALRQSILKKAFEGKLLNKT